MDALHLLLNRHSCGRLAEPAPSGEVLDNILKAGLRAPDHGTLTPWQFILFEGEGRERLGTLLAMPPMPVARMRTVSRSAAPRPACSLVIAVATRYQAHPKVPKLEQELSAGCALMAMQMAAQAQGFNGIWRSGWFIFDEQIHGALGLAPEDQLVGFLYLGTPMLEARKLRELPIADFVRASESQIRQKP
jgi:nitroreductase